MAKISSNELREKYQAFFVKHGHKQIIGSSLVPESDPSVLFTTAGMHPLVPYLQGQPHPQGKKLTNVQRCLRTTDIEEVGDATHATVFEMLGNWSLGDYGKEEAIKLSWQFLTEKKWLSLSPARIAVSVFAGDKNSPRDETAAQVWQMMGLPLERIAYLDNQENWWPAGGNDSGPQGPDTEIFYWTGEDAAPVTFDPKNKQWMEIWNNVFMEFIHAASGNLTPLQQKNVDTGMGLERIVMALNGMSSIYDIDTYVPLMKWLRTDYFQDNDIEDKKLRIIADHIKAVTFVMTDENNVTPSNTEQGYVLRRLIRRAVVTAQSLGARDFARLFREGMEMMVLQYESVYELMRGNLSAAQTAVEQEIIKFEGSLNRGMKKFAEIEQKSSEKISGGDLLLLLQSFGFPVEITTEMAREKGKGVDLPGFRRKFAEHQARSRAGSTKKFKGGLMDQSVTAQQYHTATHLLHAALRKLLGEQVSQKGSNITTERLRFDFNYDRKLTKGEISKIEEMVNRAIEDRLDVERTETTVDHARQIGAVGLFKEKYGNKVSVYKIGNFSTEICGGPHVKNTGDLGRFKIIKEEATAAGIRRIKAILVEPGRRGYETKHVAQ